MVMKDTSDSDESTELFIFWIKLKTDLSFEQITSLLDQNNETSLQNV